MVFLARAMERRRSLSESETDSLPSDSSEDSDQDDSLEEESSFLEDLRRGKGGGGMSTELEYNP